MEEEAIRRRNSEPLRPRVMRRSARKDSGEALTGARAGWAMEPRNCVHFRAPTLFAFAEVRVWRQTMRKRWQAKLKELNIQLRRRRHDPIPEQGAYLGAVVRGHIQYYGVPGNALAIRAFHRAVARLWHKALGGRSQKARLAWDRMKKYIARWLPNARICHPPPASRFAVRT